MYNVFLQQHEFIRRKDTKSFFEFAVSRCRMPVAMRKSLFQNTYTRSYWLSKNRQNSLQGGEFTICVLAIKCFRVSSNEKDYGSSARDCYVYSRSCRPVICGLFVKICLFQSIKRRHGSVASLTALATFQNIIL